MERVRKHYIFSGYVQGVGFRWRAYHTAQRFGVTGWVKNLDDGSVEMEAEGLPVDLDALQSVLEENSWASISDIRIRTIPQQFDCDFVIL